MLRIIKNRGHFPKDDAVIKLLSFAIRDIEDKPACAQGTRAASSERRAAGELVDGSTAIGWKEPSARTLWPAPKASVFS